MVDSSSEEEDTEYCTEDNPEVAHGNCCKEQQLENEALRKRIQKLRGRLLSLILKYSMYVRVFLAINNNIIKN